MEGNSLYVTRKEFYYAAMHICLLVLFTGVLSDEEGFGRLYIVFWAAGLEFYYAYKLRKARKAESTMDLRSE